MQLAPRTYLFVPGDRPERFAKAVASGADQIILDLEDAVSPPAKVAARDQVALALNGNRDFVVRVNAPDSDWFEDDLAMCREGRPAAVLVPKAEDPALMRDVVARLGGNIAVLALIETARGVRQVDGIAAVSGVERLVFGSIDLQLDLGMDGEDELNVFRVQLVVASRLADIAAPVDGVTTALDDATQLTADTARARRLGFGGKLCIHPRQVALVNEGFTPGAAEIQWAHRVVAAAAAAPGGAAALDGKMLDKPVIARAERLLAQARILGRK